MIGAATGRRALQRAGGVARSSVSRALNSSSISSGSKRSLALVRGAVSSAEDIHIYERTHTDCTYLDSTRREAQLARSQACKLVRRQACKEDLREF